MKKRVGIIGGGPAGLMAAIRASEIHDVIVFEKNSQCGRKLLMTGNGRCNITNNKDVRTFLDNCSKSSKFLYYALNNFGPSDIINFFSDNNCALKEENDNRMFPVSEKAKHILDVLKQKASEVEFRYNSNVEEIVVENNEVLGVIVNGELINLDAVVVATGGLSYQATGSNGDGHKMLEKAGHSITELKPCEVALKSDNRDILNKSLMGLSLQNKLVEVVVNDKVIASSSGDLIFTHFGLSGPVILKLSEIALEHENSQIRINHKLESFNGFKETRKNLNVPKRYWDYLVKDTDMKPIEQISKKDRQLLYRQFNYQSFRITGSLGIEKAVITNGGVSCNEFDRKTLESKLVNNLYVCGELLNVHGSVGGYNLTLALTSGNLVGISV